MLKVRSEKELENLVETYMKQAYDEADYLRSYNLLKLLVKINPENKSALYYSTLLKPSLLKKTERRWLWYTFWQDLLLKPKIYFYLWLIFLFNKLR